MLIQLHAWSLQVTVAVTPNGRADAVCNIEHSHDSHQQQAHFVLPLERQMRIPDFLEHLVNQQPFSQQQHLHGTSSLHSMCHRSQHEVMYIQQQNGNFTTHFPELVDDVDAELQWASEAFGTSPDAVNLWIGNDRSVTSFHKDHYENNYAVIAGEKTFTLLPPCDIHRMHLAQYPVAACHDTELGLQLVPSPAGEHVQWSPIEDLATGTCSNEYQQQYSAYFDPLMPKPLRITVRAGEVLYLPSLWWHQVEQAAGKDNMVIAVNYWYDMQFDCKYAYYQLVESLAVANDHLRQERVDSTKAVNGGMADSSTDPS